MGRGQALFVALVIAALVVRSLVRGDAAVGDGLRRAEFPKLYWGIIASGVGAFATMLYLAWSASAA